MGEMEKVRKKKVILIVMFLFLGIGILMQHQLVGMYFDDFGNASLSYGYDSSFIDGTEYTFKELLAWAKNIYSNWSGRILYALIMIPMMKESIRPFMIFQSIILLLIFAVMYRIVKRYCSFDEEPLILIGFVIIYGLFTGTILSYGIYWASASVLYLLPILPFLLCVEKYESAKANLAIEEVGKKTYVQIGLLIPWITLSQEQIGGAFLVWIICRIVLGNIKKENRSIKLDVFVFLWSLFTFLLFFAAPGNWVRMDSNLEFSNLSFLQKIYKNVPVLAFVLTGNDLLGINILLWISGVIMLYILKRKKEKIFLMLGIIPFGVYLINKGFSKFIDKEIISFQFCTISYFLFIISMFFIMILFFQQIQYIQFLAIMIAAVASVFCLLLSPAIALRSCIPYAFICMIFIEIIVYYFFKDVSQKVLQYIGVLALCIITFVSINNLIKIYSGYKENYRVEQYNWRILETYNGVEEEIVLEKYVNEIYRGPAPYEEGFEFCETWIKEYFNIPQAVVFVWEESNNK